MIDNKILLSPGDIYDDLKTKTKEQLRVEQYAELFYTSLMEMFTYENLPDTLPKRFLEGILLRTGQVFIWKDGDNLICSPGTLGGEVDPYGMGTTCIATALNGHRKEGKRNDDIIYGINNDLQAPETFIMWLIHICNEIDLSLDLNVLYSRYLPAPIVRDEKTKRAFDEYIRKISTGEMSAVLSDNVLNSELGMTEQTLEITDVNRIDKVQYLSRLRDDIMKTFYNRYGQALQTQNKSAQQTTDEIHGMDSASFIIPLNMYKCRLDLIEKVNARFGTDIKVEFSEPWKYELERYKNNAEGVENETEPIETDQKQTEPIETDQKQTEGKQADNVDIDNNFVDKSEKAEETLTDSEAVETIKKVIDLTENGGDEND